MQEIFRFYGIVTILVIWGMLCGCSDKGKSKGRESETGAVDSNTATVDTGTGLVDSESATDDFPPAPVEVHLGFEGATAMPAYWVTVVAGDASVTRAVCSNDAPAADPGISCTPTGVRIETVTGVFHLTVKARGYGFVSQTVSPQTLSRQAGVPFYPVALVPLAPYEVDDLYRTGFAPGELDAFLSMAYRTKSETGAVDAVKFIVMNPHTNPVVYFMNTSKFPIHYIFARDVLKLPLGSVEFTQKVYAEGEREIMAGAIMYHATVEADSERLGAPIVSPFELSFFPSDNLSVAQARLVYRLIEERLGVAALQGQSQRLYYMPAGAQKEAELEAEESLFDEWDAGWVLRSEIYKQKSWQIMNTGLAYGTLRLADLDALEAEAFSYRDILVLPVLPIQLPIVGGTITREFQTPLSHVNVMAKNRGTPNLTLTDATTHPDVAPLLGKMVRFEVTDDGYSLAETTLAEAEAHWASQQKAPVTLESDTTYTGLPLFTEIGFSDWVCVGAKAANLAELHQLLGALGPRGFAVPFHYYQMYMDINTVTGDACDGAQVDCVAEGRSTDICTGAQTICRASDGMTFSAYAAAIIQNETVARDTRLREATLAGLRYLIKNGTMDFAFATALDARVAEVFGADKVRLRSSTNTEDIPGFSGAGLYDSKSAYATGEDRASLEIRKVWASVWNWRAFEERSFWNIDHLSTRMGVAVNQSFGEEAANGVLITQNIGNPTLEGMYVNVQLGEISVTNPEGMYSPEIFTIIRGTQPGTVQAARLSYSSLSPDSPIMTDEEITALHVAATKVQNHFAELYDKPAYVLALDIEFKLLAGDRALVLKQARPYAY